MRTVTAYMPQAVRTDWRTPGWLFAQLHAVHRFTLDAAADDSNALCPRYFTPTHSALAPDTAWRGRVYCNPPYGRGLAAWTAKAQAEYHAGRAEVIVMLLPARTDTKWFHEHCWGQPGASVAFLKGRLQYQDMRKPAPFPSMIVVWGEAPCAGV